MRTAIGSKSAPRFCVSFERQAAIFGNFLWSLPSRSRAHIEQHAPGPSGDGCGAGLPSGPSKSLPVKSYLLQRSRPCLKTPQKFNAKLVGAQEKSRASWVVPLRNGADRIMLLLRQVRSGRQHRAAEEYQAHHCRTGRCDRDRRRTGGRSPSHPAAPQPHSLAAPSASGHCVRHAGEAMRDICRSARLRTQH